MKKTLKTICIVTGILTGVFALYYILAPKSEEELESEDEDFDSEFYDEDIANEAW